MLTGCGTKSETFNQFDSDELRSLDKTNSETVKPKRELRKRDFDIIRFVVANLKNSSSDQTRFLTTTPFEQWGPSGDWESLPDHFHQSIDDLPIKYLPAEKAELKRGYVNGVETGVPATMIWVNVKEWISDSEVVVETGSWSGPLDAAGATKK